MSQIEFRKVSKIYKKEEKGRGIRRLIPKKTTVRALSGVSFEIEKGEFVALIGQNGSGKSTTIKLLTGILVPDEGSVGVLGFTPWEDREKYTQHIGVVFGQKSLLWWDLEAYESMKLYRDIYEVPRDEFEKRLKYFNSILKTDELMSKRVRKMSLGERMRCELVASLLHKPKVLFLDEPTIGLDVVAKTNVREFLKMINKEEGTTIILTTHDMSDIEALCKRVILIDNGKLIYDGLLEDLKKKYMKTKDIAVKFSGYKDRKLAEEGLKKCEVLERREDYCKISVDVTKHDIKKIIGDIMKAVEVTDLNVGEQDLGEVIAKIYKSGKV